MSRAVKINVLQTVSIVIYNLFQAVNSRIEDITIHRETMSCTLSKRRNCATKSVQIDEFVAVVELKNSTNWLNHLQVLVFLRIEEMEWARVLRRPVRKGEIDGDAQVNITATKDVF